MESSDSQKDMTSVRQGKRPKKFLDKSAALKLAESIAGVQEKKAASKVEGHHKPQVGLPRKDRTPRVSTSRTKLKETKALLVSQRSRLKKERAKLRKGLPEDSGNAQPDGIPRKLRKSVSFA